MINDANPAYLPKKIGVAEPIRTPFSMDKAREIWMESERPNKLNGGVMFKGWKTRGDIDWIYKDNANIISMTIELDLLLANNGVERFIEMSKKMFIWANGVYGYACHDTNTIYTPGLTHRTCIGGITWMTLFGPPYVKMFGKEVIQTVPCIAKEFAEDHFMILTSDKPIAQYPELAKIEDEVKKHLGEDAFCCKHIPKVLSMEDLLAGKDRVSEEGYRSPDLSAYIKKNCSRDEDKDFVLVIDEKGQMTEYILKQNNKLT